jgi:pyrroline-5-carboxylate reductase
MVQDTGLDPSELKDNVASPRGVTFEAIAKLHEMGFKDYGKNAVEAATCKAKDQGGRE